MPKEGSVQEGGKEVHGWEGYLSFLKRSCYSLQAFGSCLSPSRKIAEREKISVERLNYELYPFQQKILEKMSGSTLVVGLPTGLGKTYLAGAYVHKLTCRNPSRVAFLTPSLPLGVQQTLFARKQLNLANAYFISGSIPPERRRELMVWNAGYVVTTPQTLYNDLLSGYEDEIERAKATEDPVKSLSEVFMSEGFKFPYDILIADECHGYIGETDGYSILISAKASGCKILALSATPQLHAPKRFSELRKVFEVVETISIDDPMIKGQMPEREIFLYQVPVDSTLLAVYRELYNVTKELQQKVSRLYGTAHARGYCREHGLCVCLIALRIMRTRIVEDGASSVSKYGIWSMRELRIARAGGKSVLQLYQECLRKQPNHKISAALRLLSVERFKKAIVFVESVEAAKEIGEILHKERGFEDVAVLVGKGDMSMEDQASALLQFREGASVLICTSIGEEGLDVPTADIEIWIDPPSNPKKWIQRFGRILRKSDGKAVARICALVTPMTHEKRKLTGVLRKVEKVYGFTQKVMDAELPRETAKSQSRLTWFR
ncbi:MAG: helicase-related protein [Candidatus Verstraetearchaeota archaeon]|nr:helicase-related protein [Candidatus Verstraetearchaeota archaeon]